MTIYFLDSSALAKRYVTEIGTGWVKSITDRRSGHTIIVAQFTQVEIVSAITRRQREGAVTPRTLRAIRLLVDRHASREYTVVAVSVSIIQRAETLLEKHPLRAYDSLQLASALESNAQLLASGLRALTFVSGDRRLLGAAASEGLTIDDPNAHP